MANRNPNTSGLRPFGEDNPPPRNGRPKGAINRSTWARRVLKAKMPGKVKDPFGFAEDPEEMTIGELGTLQQAKKMLKGDLSAYTELMDAGFGKKPDIVVGDPDHVNDLFDDDFTDDPEEAARFYEEELRNP